MSHDHDPFTESEMFRCVADTLREPLVILNAGLKVQLANPAFYQMFQVSAQETLGRRIFELGNGQWNIPCLRNLLEDVLPRENTLEDFLVEHDFERIGHKTMLLNARRLGDYHLILLAIEDVTTRKRAEEQLEQEAARSRYQLSLMNTITGQAAEALYLLDAHGRITFMNPAAERIFGWSREESLGRCLHDLIHSRRPDGSSYPLRDCPLAAVAWTGQGVANHEDLFFRKDGGLVPVHCCNAPVLEDGRITGSVLVASDITERKHYEGVLRQRAEELAEEARRKDEFLAMLAHELRNPLAPVLTGIHLIQRSQPLLPVVQRALVRMERQINQMTRLVDDLLDVSRITRGKIELQKQEVELADLIANAVETVRHHIEARRHRMHFDCKPLRLRGDPTRLQQVVANLVNNAAKYTPDTGDIWLSLRQEGSEAVFTVRDSGIGISREYLSRVFDLFVQEDRPDKPPGGLGIGLTLVRRLVEMHGGQVLAQSDGEGKGSAFEVRLPILQPAPASRPAPTEAAGPEGGPVRVLIIDDNADAADNLAALLNLDDFDTHTAYDGESGVEAANRLRPDVVLLDIGLPGIDGYEVARRLAGENKPLLVAVTGYGQKSDRMRTRNAGFDEHLVKPVSPDKLLSILSAVRK